MAVTTVPKDYHSLTPFVVVGDVEAAVAFYAEAFGARTAIRREVKGRLLLADVIIGDSHLVISDRANEEGPLSAGNRLYLRVYVPDIDAALARAISAGARQTAAPEDMYWGDRVGELTDPFGFRWKVSQHLQDLDHREIERRMHAAIG